MRIARLNAAVMFGCAAWLAAGCGAPVRYPPGGSAAAPDRAAVEARLAAPSTVTETTEPYVKAVAVAYAEPQRGGVSLRMADAPLQQVLESVARARGYGVTFVGTARGSRPVTVEVNNESFAAAMRLIALAAGYAAVVDEHARQVLVAEEATYIYRVPAALAERTTAQYAVQSNPGAGGGSSSNPAGAGASGAPGAVGVAGSGAAGVAGVAGGLGGSGTTISGASIRSGDALIASLASIVGGNGANRIQYVPETALVSVRGNALQLRRVSDLMDAVCRETEQQIQVEAAFIDVSLTRQFQFGIDWQRVLSGGLLGGGTPVALQLNGAAAVAAPTLQASVTGGSVKSVINALEGLTRVRVVAQPNVITRNHGDAILYRGRQRPYLAEVDQQAVANVGTSTAAHVGFVSEGTSLALRASIVDGRRVDLRIAPQQIQGVTFQTFTFGTNASVTAPDFPLAQAYLSLIVEPGRTYLIGGLDLDRDSDTDRHVPGLAQVPLFDRLLTSTTRDGERTQLVLLLAAHILPGPARSSSLVGESL